MSIKATFALLVAIVSYATLLTGYHLLILYQTMPVSDLHQSPASQVMSFYNNTEIEDCSLPYVSINTGGRLGNKICQYMSLSLFRSVFGLRVAIQEDMKSYLRKIFPKLSLPVEGTKCFLTNTSRENFSNLYSKLSVQNAASVGAVFDSKLHPYPLSESVYIYNNPCPWSLLLPLRDHLRRELVFNDIILNKAKHHLNHAVKSLHNNATKNITIITVHVRRTDYLNYIKVHYQLKPLEKVYFQRAFKFLRNKVASPVFAVTSDDPEWCQNNIMDEVVVFVGTKDPVMDMALLSLGDHHVITYGTYGFVSAFLGKGTIVYPDNKDRPAFSCLNSSILLPISRD